MGFILKLLGGSIGPYVAGAIGAAFLALGAAVGVQHLMLKADAGTISGLRTSFATEQSAFKTEQGLVHASEAARTTDHTDAVADANKTSSICETRVAKARVTTAAIDTLLNKAPTHAPDPVEPELLTAGELRIATGR